MATALVFVSFFAQAGTAEQQPKADIPSHCTDKGTVAYRGTCVYGKWVQVVSSVGAVACPPGAVFTGELYENNKLVGGPCLKLERKKEEDKK